MKPSSVFILAAAIMFFVASFATVPEDTPADLGRAYFALGVANVFFAVL